MGASAPLAGGDRLARDPRCRFLGVRAAVGPPVERVQRPGDGFRARAHRARAAVRRPERRRVHRRLPGRQLGGSADGVPAPGGRRSRRPRRAERAGCSARAGRSARPVRERDLDARPRAGEGAHRRRSCARSAVRPGLGPTSPARPRSSTTSTRSSTTIFGRARRSRSRSRCSSCSRCSGCRSRSRSRFLFAACTVFGTLGIVYVAAHYMTTPTYVTNLVFLIGIGIAIDYSLLIVYRFREELGRGLEVEEAVLRTMETAGRAVIVSGFTVAIGLALLLFMPLPFMRAMGVGGFLIPIVSILAAATLQPALLAIYGRRGTHRAHVANWLRLPVRQVGRRRRAPVLGASGALDHAAQVAVRGGGRGACWSRGRSRSPGSSSPRARPRGSRSTPSRCRGSRCSRAPSAPGAIAPAQVLVDGGRPGGARSPEVEAAITRLVGELVRDPEVAAAYHADGGRFVDPTGRWAQVIVATRHEYGSEEAQDFARRLRSELIPAARFPEGADVRAGGAPPQGVDFLDRAYGAFPWLVLGVLALTYLLLMRAFRSLRPAAEGGDPQPALGRGRLRGARRRLPLRVRQGRVRLLPVPPGRGLDPDLPVRDDLRPLDGLRGLPRLADARGMGRDPRQCARGRDRARADRPDHHGRGDRSWSRPSPGSWPDRSSACRSSAAGSRSRSSSTRRSCAACSCPR